jgi:hypothetical protein
LFLASPLLHYRTVFNWKLVMSILLNSDTNTLLLFGPLYVIFLYDDYKQLQRLHIAYLYYIKQNLSFLTSLSRWALSHRNLQTVITPWQLWYTEWQENTLHYIHTMKSSTPLSYTYKKKSICTVHKLYSF